MLPGKTYTPEDIVRIALRRIWWIVVPLVLGTIAAVAIAKTLPNKYRSETLIMLVPQRVPDSYVKAAVTSNIEDHLATLESQILSRSRLERIILDLDLYAAQRRSLPMEEVVQRMRGDIVVKIEGKESFRVSYISRDAGTAQQTTERIASLFIQENLQDRENVAQDTNQFLDSQLEDAKRRLVEHEKKLEEYRLRYGGELPSQAPANLQVIQNAQMQLQTLAEATDRARERRLLIERQIADLHTPDLTTSATPAPAADGAAGESTAQQLDAARTRLDALLDHDKPDHPDVKATQRTIRDLEARLEAERRRPRSAAAPQRVAPSPAEIAREKRLDDLKAQIDEIDAELKGKEEQDKRLRGVIAEYQAKVDVVPKHESRLVELTRDYTTLQNSYGNLLAKREESKIAANLERRNIGEQFKILDRARVPERPFSPNRPLIDVAGAALGLAAGVLLAAFLEYRDSSFSCEADIVRLLSLPVLALVPAMTTNVERRTRRRRRIAIGVGIGVLVLTSAAVTLWRLQS